MLSSFVMSSCEISISKVAGGVYPFVLSLALEELRANILLNRRMIGLRGIVNYVWEYERWIGLNDTKINLILCYSSLIFKYKRIANSHKHLVVFVIVFDITFCLN